MADRERDIERYFKQQVEKFGALVWKFSSGGAGVPDRLILFPDNSICFAEIKAPGRTLRPLQKTVKKRLERKGFKVWVIDGRLKVKEFVEFYFKGGEESGVQAALIPAGSDPPADSE